MYNRYVGNTGKFYRVEEERDAVLHGNEEHHHPHPPSQHEKKEEHIPGHHSHSTSDAAKKPSFLSGGLGFLDNLIPFGFETSDLFLLFLLLFLFIESGDEEFLIMLGFFAYSIFKERNDK